MSKSGLLTQSHRRGEASRRILHALASEFPTMHNRHSLLRCPSLLEQHGKRPSERLSDGELKAVSKTLGRLIGDKGSPTSGAISEILLLRGEDDRVNLPESGLLAVSVDIATLREEEWIRAKLGKDPEAYSRTAAERGPLLPFERDTSQEGIVEEIIHKTRTWLHNNVADGYLPVLLTNVSIIHGSNDFDILINVSMKDEESLLRYTREVVQRVPHVRGTQTMLVSEGYGFSDLSEAMHGISRS